MKPSMTTRTWVTVMMTVTIIGCGSVTTTRDAATEAAGSAGSGGTTGSAGAGGRAGTTGGGGVGGVVGGNCSAQAEGCVDRACCTGLTCCGGVPANNVCYVTCPVSDRNMKQDFAPVDRDGILEALARLPISTWRYKTDASEARHIGPMAQDFMATFEVGASDKTIFQVDADGVAFASIQALYGEIKRLEAQNAKLGSELSALRDELRHGRVKNRKP